MIWAMTNKLNIYLFYKPTKCYGNFRILDRFTEYVTFSYFFKQNSVDIVLILDFQL